jgi:hypothetical protein
MGMSMISIAHAVTDDKTLQMLNEYCLQHTSDILQWLQFSGMT